MPLNISSKADTSSVLYRGRAKTCEKNDISAMADNPEIGWRARLDEAIKASGKSRLGRENFILYRG